MDYGEQVTNYLFLFYYIILYYLIVFISFWFLSGIGCFFDDAVHEMVGIHDTSYQSLYHFTIGGPIEDTRLQTLEGYSAKGTHEEL